METLVSKTEGVVVFENFPEEAFRFSVDCDRIWLESKESFQQWESNVEGVVKYAPHGFSLPRDVILDCVATAFNSNPTTDPPAINLKRYGENNKSMDLLLWLTLRVPGSTVSFDWKYAFPMTPLALERTDLLVSQIRDLQEKVKTLQEAVEHHSTIAVIQEGSGILSVHVHRIEASFSEKINGDELFSVQFAVGGDYKRTAFQTVNDSIDEELCFIIEGAINSKKISIEVFQQHRKCSFVSTTKSVLELCDNEHKFTFKTGSRSSFSLLELYFSIEWLPRYRKISEINLS